MPKVKRTVVLRKPMPKKHEETSSYRGPTPAMAECFLCDLGLPHWHRRGGE